MSKAKSVSVQMRWVFANILGAGDVFFKTSDEMVPYKTITCFCLTQLGHDKEGSPVVQPMRGYKVGAFHDPMNITMATVVFWCYANEQACENLDEVWSSIVKPSLIDVNRFGRKS